MKPIYSAVVYKYDRKEGNRVMYVKAPCTSEAAAKAYAKILAKWWQGYHVGVDKDFQTTVATAKALEQLPF